MGGSRRTFHKVFEINALPMRSVQYVQKVWSFLTDESTLSKTDVATVILNNGIKSKTTLFRIPTCKPFAWFPIDSMHLIQNLLKDILGLLKGENNHLRRLETQDGVLISTEQ